MRSLLARSPAASVATTPDAAVHATSLALVAEDRTWVERVRAGDTDVFRQMFEAYYEPLCGFAMMYVDSHVAAEEIVQDLFAWIWAERARWVVRDTVRTYLFGATRNRALNARRDARAHERWADRAAREPTPPGQGQGPPPVDEPLRRAELGRALDQAVAALPERRRQAFTLRWQYHLSNVEIARIMGISVKGVEIALTHAFRTLRSELSGFF